MPTSDTLRRTLKCAVVALGLAGLVGLAVKIHATGTGRSFTYLHPDFTQDLFGASQDLGVPDGVPNILGGVAFAPNGDVWASECVFFGTKLHRFLAAGTTRATETIVDLTGVAGGCGLVNHPDGSLYSNSAAGLWKLNASTGAIEGGPLGAPGSALGIAVDPLVDLDGHHHLVYVGDDCHPTLSPDSTTCTLWDFDPVGSSTRVFARLTRSPYMLLDGLFFDPSGQYVFAAHRDFDDNFIEHHALAVIRRPMATGAPDAAVDDSQIAQLVPMTSEPDGVAFSATGTFVVTLNESDDGGMPTACVSPGSPNTVPSDANGLCAYPSTPVGGTMTRFDFPNGFSAPPIASTFASGGFRGDLLNVGADGCLYGTQGRLFESGGQSGVRYDDGSMNPPDVFDENGSVVVSNNVNSLVQICGGGGFVPPAGVATARIGDFVWRDRNGNGIQDMGEPGLPNIRLTLHDAQGALVGATTTDTSGAYLFDHLRAGSYTVTVDATTLPAGLMETTSLAGSDRSVDSNGSPATVTLATNVSEDLSIDFGYKSNLALACVSETTGQVGVAYSASYAASGGSAPFTYTLISGTLPPGLTLTAEGVLSGIPTSSGPFTFTVKVTDADGDSATTSGCGLVIAPAPLTLACAGTSAGQAGVSFNSGIPTVTGGVAPYTFSIVGTLPAGLTLNANGSVTGTPTAAGSFSLQVADSASPQVTTTGCPITIAAAAPLVLTCAATSAGQVGVPFSSGAPTVSGGVGPYTFSIVGTLPAGLTFNPLTGAVTGTPTTAGPFSFTSQVVDSRGNAAGTTTSNCGITIEVAAPALACAASTGQVGVPYSSALVASGGVGPYTYSIETGALPTGLSLNPATGAITGTPTTAGPFTFTSKVVDSRGNAAGTTTSNCGITIEVAAPALACAASTGQVGVPYSSALVASGGVGPYTYSIETGALPTGLSLNAATGAITGTPTTAGPFTFTSKVVDSRGNAAGTTTSNCGITIDVAAPALACAASTGQVGVPYSSALVASGGVGPYTYSIETGALPTGLSLNPATGAITGTPLTAGPFSFTSKVVDSRGNAAGTTTSNCGITITEAAPALACAASTGQVGVPYSSALVATGGVAPYTYSITSGALPTGLNLNPATGAITGTPTTFGPFSFTSQVVDSRGNAAGTTSSNCGITIAPAPVSLTCAATSTGQVGLPFNSGVPTVTGGVGPYTFSIVGTLPAGLTLNANGSVSGTPSASGSFSVKVTDSLGTTTTACPITINPAPALVLTCAATSTGQVGLAFNSGVPTVTGGVAPYSFTIVGTLPAGLTLNANGSVSGTPSASGSFSVKVTDSLGTTTTACPITINPAPALVLTCAATSVGQVGLAFNSGVPTVTGGVAPYTFSIVGTLPAGLTLNATGSVSGTPSASGSFSVKVTDAMGTTTTNCPITIQAAAPALACATSTGQVNVAYSSALIATGGVAPYTYSILAGSLPAGLTLNVSTGAITGTPTTAGAFNFTAKVVDARGTSAGTTTSNCAITVSSAPPPPPAPQLLVTKTANPTTYAYVGQVIGYTYVVQNTGNVSISGPFTVTDDKLGAFQCGVGTTLTAGNSLTCLATYAIQASDLGTALALPTGVVANINTGAWLQGVMSTQDTSISGAGPNVPDGIYPGWCIQDHVPNDLHNQPATLYSTIGGSLPADVVALKWGSINWILNHKVHAAGKSDLDFFKDVQTAIWKTLGEQNPDFGTSATALQMYNDGQAHQSFVPGPTDVVAVIVYSDGMGTSQSSIQESIIELKPFQQITNHVVVSASYNGGTIASAQAQATVSQVAQAPPVDAVAAGDKSTASTTVTTGALTTTGSNELLLAFVGADNTSGTTTVTGISGAGLTWTLVKRSNVQRGTAEIWRAFATGPITNATITATLSQSVVSSLTVVALTGVETSGTNGSGAIGATMASNGASGAPTVTLTTTKNNSWVFGVGNDWDNPIGRIVGANQGLIHQYLPPAGDTFWVQRLINAVAASGTSATLNDTAPTTDRWNFAAVEILPAGSYGPPVSVPNVVSMTQSTATTTLTNAGLTLGAVTTASSASVPSGSVISQNPTAGSQATSGSAVALVVSTGPAAASPQVDKVIYSEGAGKRTTAAFSTTTAGEVLLAFVGSDGPNSAGSQSVTVSGAGLTWTLVKRANAQAGTSEVWKATAAGILTNVTVSSTQANSAYRQSMTVVAFTGATGVGASNGASAASGAPTVSLTTTKANSVVYGAGNDWDTATARTLGASQTLVHQWVDSSTGDTYWVQSRTTPVAAAGTVAQVNDTAPTADRWNLVAVEVVP